MTTDPYRDALAELLTAYDRNDRAGCEVGLQLCKRKDVKDGFALLARYFKGRIGRESVLQRCVEAEPSHPLHQAVRALALAGALPSTPWAPVFQVAPPKRWVTRLMVSRHAPVVYAVEADGRVSVWSLETGELVVDLALPGGKKTKASELVELADGTLRVVASDGVVVERAPGGRAFVKVFALGDVSRGWARSPDLRLHVTRPEFQPVEQDGVKVHRIAVHDVVARTTRELRLPIDYPWSTFVWTEWEGGRGALIGKRSFQTGPDEWQEEHSLFLIDPVTASFEQIKFAQELQYIDVGARPGTLKLTAESGELEYDLKTRESKELRDEGARAGWGEVALGDGLRYDLRARTIFDAEERVVGGYALAGDPHATVAAWDAARGQLVLAGGDPAVALTIVRPWDPRREDAAPPAAAAPPEPLAWARPGVRLEVSIADFDAEDTYTFAVLAAEDGLALAIHMGDEVVAEAARFSEAALESATKTVSIAQGGADVDLSEEQTKVVPPIVIARASAAKLAAGKALAWKSAWSDGAKLAGATRETCVVRVDGAERRVAAITATADEVTLTVLDDPRWPLVLARVEGDCHVRIESIDTSRAGAAAPAEPAEPAAPKAAKAKAAKAKAAKAGAPRRAGA